MSVDACLMTRGDIADSAPSAGGAAGVSQALVASSRIQALYRAFMVFSFLR
jgi:hypothetical protein